MESNSDVWKEKHNQYREVIDQLGELKNKAAKYKKCIRNIGYEL